MGSVPKSVFNAYKLEEIVVMRLAKIAKNVREVKGTVSCMAVLFILPIRVLYALWSFMLAKKFTCK